MKLIIIIAIVGILGSLSDCRSSGSSEEVDLDAFCDPACALPDCLCSNVAPPPSLSDTPEKVPQIVYLTFGSAINVVNYPFYNDELLNGRKNPNGAEISVTFFTTHEYNDYSFTHQLWRRGQEIALESITHKSSTTYWKELNYTGWVEEMIDQRELISTFANIPEEEIVGVRAPFLQIGGDVMYRALRENGIQYDSSRPTWQLRKPALWPYTADNATIQECQIAPCPVESHPGFWVSPLVDLLGSNDQPCAFVDTCQDAPLNVDETFELLRRNFEDHHNGSRAPFGVYVQAAWLQTPESPWIKEGYLKFVDYVLSLGDTYIVSIKKGLEWVRNPVDLDNIMTFDPWLDQDIPRDGCRNSFSCVFDDAHTPPDVRGERLMKVCTLCPTNYPWLKNPLGD